MQENIPYTDPYNDDGRMSKAQVYFR